MPKGSSMDIRSSYSLRILILFAMCAMLMWGCPGIGSEESELAGETPTWIGQIQSLMRNNCAYCHQNPPQNYAPYGFRFDVYNADEANDGWNGAYEERYQILEEAVLELTMPPTGPLSEEDRLLLKAWVEGGAPRGER